MVWETAYLAHAGRIRLPGRSEARSALNLGDFFDELIVGAARAQRLPLLTRAGAITQSGLVLVRW